MTRRLLLFLVAVLAVSGSLVAGAGTITERDAALRGYTNPARDAAIPFHTPRLGVNADLMQYTPDDLRIQLDLMRRAGIVWVRQRFDWTQLTSRADIRARHDELFRAVSENDTPKLVAVLTDPTGTSPDKQRFAEAAGAFASVYGDYIDVYEVWDEPNLGAVWDDAPNPTAYAALLSSAYSAIHEHDSTAAVSSGALAPTLETGPTNLSDLLFLDALYRLGVKDFSDIVAAKPYGFDSPPNMHPSQAVLNFNRIVLLRDIMRKHNDLTTPLWASEWGWNSLPTGWEGMPSIWGGVSADAQVTYTLQALGLVEDRYPWLGGMILAEWQPSADVVDPRWGFALRGTHGDTTRLYEVLAGSAHSVVAAPVGLYPANTTFARYTGVWTFGELGADIGWVGDSSLEFSFQGNSISLLVREGDYTAYLYATVNGEPANALPADASGNAYLLLTSDTRLPEVRLVPVADDLGPGTHMLRLIAERGWDQWSLVGFAVGGADLTAPFNRQLGLAVVSMLLSGAALIVFGSQLPYEPGLQRLSRILLHINRLGMLMLALFAALLMLIGMLLTWRDAVPDILRREPVQLGLALLTGGLLYLNPAFVLSALAAVILFVIFFHKPLIGLILTLLFAPFFLFPVELYRFAFPMSELLILITFAAWSLRSGVTWAHNRRNPLQSRPQRSWQILDLLLVIYLVMGIVSLTWTEYRTFALTELRTLFVEPMLFYVILRTSRPRSEDWLRLADAVIVSAVIVAIIGLFLYLRGDAVITAEDGARRLASVYGSPNNVALWLGRAFPFALAFALAPLNPRRRLLMAAAALFILVTIGLTLSAGAYFLGIPAALVAVLVLTYRKRSLRSLLAIAALGAVALPVLAQFPRFARLLDPTDGTNFFRIRVWQSAINMIRNHPVTGIGQDQFLAYFQGRYILPDAWQEPGLSHPHNFIFDVWLRLGIVGLVWIAVMLVVLSRILLRAYGRLIKDANKRVEAALCIGVLGTLANMFVHGLIDNSLFVNDLIYVFVFTVGFAAWTQETA